VLAPGTSGPATSWRPSMSGKGRLLLLCVALVPLSMASCIFQMAGPGTDDQPGDLDPGVPFLQKPSPQHVRVMSFNVGWDSIFPDDDPQNDRLRRDSKGAEFVRLLKALDPDVVCLQEINPDRDPRQVGSILDAALPLDGGRTWQADGGRDNVIVTRFTLSMRSNTLAQGSAIVRFGQAMALVDLPNEGYNRDLYLICVHFKAMGGEANIRARQEHADAIVQWIGDVKTPGDSIDLPRYTPIIVLGDLNVYDTDPAYHLTTLLSGDIVNEGKYGPDVAPDWDGTSLADAKPRQNRAGEQVYTWRDDTQGFNPGALDRILYTDSVISVDNAFVLNTNKLTEEELASARLKAGDVMLDRETGRYDHLPLVVDIALREVPPE
jgi:endonuclease/exonuclease/phosphatase family metal-dependent hydrolase